MRVLVTGKSGQVARSLIERRADREVVALGRDDLDLTSPVSIETTVARVAPDLIINAAAYTAVDRAEDEAALAQIINADAPTILAAAARRAGARIIQISTDYVFDGSADGAYRETDAVAPLGQYGRSKLAGEEAVAASGADFLIVRTAWVFSPFGTNFVKTMLRFATRRKEVAVVADQRGSPTSALDLADGIYRLADAWRTRSIAPIVHAAGTGSANWAEVARATFTASAALGGPSATVREITTVEYPTRAQRPANSVLDCTRLTEVTGWTMPEWRTALVATVGRLLS